MTEHKLLLLLLRWVVVASVLDGHFTRPFALHILLVETQCMHISKSLLFFLQQNPIVAYLDNSASQGPALQESFPGVSLKDDHRHMLGRVQAAMHKGHFLFCESLCHVAITPCFLPRDIFLPWMFIFA